MPCNEAQFCSDEAVVIIANTWQPLGASGQLTLRHSAAEVLLFVIVLPGGRENNRYDCAHRSSRISTGLAYPPLPGATPYATVKPRLDVRITVTRGTCGEPHIHPKGNGLLLITPRTPYISAIYIPWLRRSFRVKAFMGPASKKISW